MAAALQVQITYTKLCPLKATCNQRQLCGFYHDTNDCVYGTHCKQFNPNTATCRLQHPKLKSLCKAGYKCTDKLSCLYYHAHGDCAAWAAEIREAVLNNALQNLSKENEQLKQQAINQASVVPPLVQAQINNMVIMYNQMVAQKLGLEEEKNKLVADNKNLDNIAKTEAQERVRLQNECSMLRENNNKMQTEYAKLHAEYERIKGIVDTSDKKFIDMQVKMKLLESELGGMKDEKLQHKKELFVKFANSIKTDLSKNLKAGLVGLLK